MTYFTAGDHSVILEESGCGVVGRLLGSCVGAESEEALDSAGAEAACGCGTEADDSAAGN
jgi:hypothetical protein